MDYNYPIRHDWSTEEMIEVIAFYEVVEKAYETGILREMLMDAYRRFKKVVPSMAEEKTLFKEFENVSGYVSFKIIKAAKEGNDGEKIKGVQH
ncbi:UPF0223 family protein [Sporosarcina limicola]|uniref:UPF0223 protein H4683_000681 n=1 Tax=Sporosarcina limicola TaxID=34101 RepID=A0A927RDE7_9BACL|nr:UPF0223 family protein [Sporosarcina limicola]MBE1553607.1 uncharacterized protein YktA (UPF0223 family) [Sporosarcina limicola]